VPGEISPFYAEFSAILGEYDKNGTDSVGSSPEGFRDCRAARCDDRTEPLWRLRDGDGSYDSAGLSRRTLLSRRSFSEDGWQRRTSSDSERFFFAQNELISRAESREATTAIPPERMNQFTHVYIREPRRP